MSLVAVTEGSTELIVHKILNDGAALLIHGLTVTLILEKSDGTVIDTSGKVTILDDGSTASLKGKVQYAPAAGDFVATGSQYYWRWKIVDGSGKIAFVPNGSAERLKVYPLGKP